MSRIAARAIITRSGSMRGYQVINCKIPGYFESNTHSVSIFIL
jgi:hypothetical protein